MNLWTGALKTTLLGAACLTRCNAIAQRPASRPVTHPVYESAEDRLHDDLLYYEGLLSRLRHPPQSCWDKPPVYQVRRVFPLRLHLMRPDLILYPIVIDHYC